jgi:hypothetical protein
MTHRLIRSSLIIAGLCLTLGACDQAIEDDMTPSETPTMVTHEQEPVPIYVESLWDKAPTQLGTEIDSAALTIGGPALPVTSPTSDTAQVSGAVKTTRRQSSPTTKVGPSTDGVTTCEGVTCATASDTASDRQYAPAGIDDGPMHNPNDAPCMDEDCDGSAGLA